MTEPPIVAALRHALQTRETSLPLTEVWRERQEAIDYLDELRDRAEFAARDPDDVFGQLKALAKGLASALCIEQGRTLGRMWDPLPDIDAAREACRRLLVMIGRVAALVALVAKEKERADRAEQLLRQLERTSPAAAVLEEMLERNWCFGDLLIAMDADVTDRLALEMILLLGPTDPNVRLGVMAEKLDRAFGVSAGFFANMERLWLEGPRAEESKLAEPSEIKRRRAEDEQPSPTDLDAFGGGRGGCGMNEEQP